MITHVTMDNCSLNQALEVQYTIKSICPVYYLDNFIWLNNYMLYPVLDNWSIHDKVHFKQESNWLRSINVDNNNVCIVTVYCHCHLSKISAENCILLSISSCRWTFSFQQGLLHICFSLLAGLLRGSQLYIDLIYHVFWYIWHKLLAND